MTDLERKALEAAKEWLIDRWPSDQAEKALAAALYRAYPEDAHTRENCPCGDPGCDECPTAEQSEAMVERWETQSAVES